MPAQRFRDKFLVMFSGRHQESSFRVILFHSRKREFTLVAVQLQRIYDFPPDCAELTLAAHRRQISGNAVFRQNKMTGNSVGLVNGPVVAD